MCWPLKASKGGGGFSFQLSEVHGMGVTESIESLQPFSNAGRQMIE